MSNQSTNHLTICSSELLKPCEQVSTLIIEAMPAARRVTLLVNADWRELSFNSQIDYSAFSTQIKQDALELASDLVITAVAHVYLGTDPDNPPEYLKQILSDQAHPAMPYDHNMQMISPSWPVGICLNQQSLEQLIKLAISELEASLICKLSEWHSNPAQFTDHPLHELHGELLGNSIASAVELLTAAWGERVGGTNDPSPNLPEAANDPSNLGGAA